MFLRLQKLLNSLAFNKNWIYFQPYALKIRQTALIPTQQFFKYAAVVSSLGDTDLVCIIFDIIEAGQVIAYAGHFIVKKDFVFDPITREPVVSVSLLSVDQSACPLLFL